MLKRTSYLLLLIVFFITSACQQSDSKSSSGDSSGLDSAAAIPAGNEEASSRAASKDRKPADAATILARKEVPILCYHQIRDWKSSDSQTARDYITPVNTFKAHMKMLADSGYHSVLPDQVYNYLVYGDPLPPKPVMLTFDDTDLDQFTVAAPEMKKYGFKAVYFIMTVSIGRRGKVKYMNSDEIKQLSDAGNVIGSHTYDHKNVKKYQAEDWPIQIDKPTKRLKEITGKEIEYFAYPFGLWNKEAIPELKKRGFKAAFILSTKRDENDPLFTIRRIIASGFWSAKSLHNSMINSF
ncbi:polysaccharide deacetylase family protein [Paradesertivirga mongoliensis]|uniref:Polysaccharide deacetylase family protein n=1 Tax=Paradesertivirga mongoliensis TaxID=2100740 RepID=A0ABW4ZMS0_9SPHI|nr:polysaccharide deacetylase family protein [Pedobacter mongoliensis]